MKKEILILGFVILSFSCKSQKYSTAEIALKKCVNVGIAEYCENILDCKIDFYSLIIRVEDSLIESGLLKENAKNGYLNFIDKFSDDENKKAFEIEFEKIKTLMYDSKFDSADYTLVHEIIKGCPNQILKENKLSQESLLYKQILTLNKLEATGMIDKRILHSFVKDIKNEDFNKIIYRGPIILLTYKIMQNRIDKK